jgi:hypothetical protein
MFKDKNLPQQTLLKEYGNCIEVYQGKGTLQLINGEKHHCYFEAGQLSNGQVILLCDFLPPFPHSIQISAERFDGETSEGYQIYAEKRINEVNYLPEIPIDCNSGFWSAFHLTEMSISMTNGPLERLHFGVTNFDFLGTERVICSDNSYQHTLPLNLQGKNGTTTISMSPLNHYDRIIKRLKTLKSIDVTCEVVIDIPANGEIGQVTEMLDNLCFILSVARGTKIQWMYCDHYNDKGRIIKRTHFSRITKPYCPLEVIHSIAGSGKETKTFIEQAYPAYVNKRKSYKLDKGTIDAYLDAKAEADFLEMRGVKLAVGMEILKTVFGKALNIKDKSFESIIGKLCNSMNLGVTQQEIDLFVKCRNSLIHEGEFYCITATRGQRKKCKPLSTKTEEYLFLVNFLDKVFLKLLGYNGPYIDWSVPNKLTHQEHV